MNEVQAILGGGMIEVQAPSTFSSFMRSQSTSSKAPVQAESRFECPGRGCVWHTRLEWGFRG